MRSILSNTLTKVVVLISGNGSNLQSIIDNATSIGIEVVAVISNTKDAFGLTSCLDLNNGPIDYAMVRVPLHAFSSKLNYKFNNYLYSSLLLTYKGRTRDYGTADQSYRDQILDEYFLIDLASTYKFSNDYRLDLSLKNLLDKDYENSNLYTGTPRTIYIGLNKKY